MIDLHLVILPILIPLAGAAVALLLMGERKLQAYWTVGTMATSLAASLWLLWTVWQTNEPLIFQMGGWVAPFGISIVGDMLSAMMVVMSQIVLTMGMVYALGCKDKCVTYPTFYPLFLTLAVGLTGAFLTGDLFNFFVFAELLVISGTILTAISDDKYGVEAAYKYFYISMLAAAFLLLTNGTLYAAYGTLNMADLAARIQLDMHPLVPTAAGLLFAAFAIKGAAFPFHFWQPDFHTAAPTPVHAVLSSVVVKVGVYGMIRMTTLLFVDFNYILQPLLIVIGLIGLFYGGLGATGTYDVKRMLAYSTMGQLGFIFVGIGWGTPLSMGAALVFAFNHSLIKAAMLMLAGSVASRAPVKSAAYEVVTGVGKSIPLGGVLFFVGSLALAGIPPTNGFVSKLLLFSSGVAAGETGFGQYWPLGLMGIGSMLTLVYTMRAFQHIWWRPMPEGSKPKEKGDFLLAPAVLIILVLALGVYAEPLVSYATEVSAWLGDGNAYVQAVLDSRAVIMR